MERLEGLSDLDPVRLVVLLTVFCGGVLLVALSRALLGRTRFFRYLQEGPPWLALALSAGILVLIFVLAGWLIG
ncbi:hypothetical protein [Calidithermus roseus]|uniref:Uncharacterized protein n=1 Tax=Calidithermus roseus TaxID=1644118 RepID=A0A399F0Y3_9DEIN|nr:hypothetical protein [Calidithermus roseus]RIH89465.1 hypothetical protein Mrose_00366 [Calidithermus roseus]